MSLMAKRKTMREVRLEEYLDGYFDCLRIFEEGFREEAWKEYSRRCRLGLSTLAEHTSKEPRIDSLWSRVFKAQQDIRPKDDEYRKLREARI